MTTVDLAPETLDAAGRALTGKGPIHMVNLVRYRAQADYGERTDFAPCSGREAYYQRYVPAFNKVAQGKKFVLSWLGNAQATLVAPAGETWDDIVIVEYESLELLRSIIDSPEYEAEAAPHRRAALADWRFIATTKSEVPR